MAEVVLRPGHTTLADWRAIYRGAVVTVDPSCHAAIADGARAVDAILSKGEPVYGINTGLRPVGEHTHRAGRPDHAPAQHRGVARGRRGRADAGAAGAADAGVEAGQPGAGSIGRSGRNRAVPVCNVGEQPVASGADARFGRGIRRSRAARAHGRGDDRRRRGPARRRAQECCCRAGAGRHDTDRARRQGRLGAAEWHAILHCLCARRTVRGGDAAAGRP